MDIDSPNLITPALGTPVSGNLENCTGYPGGGGGTISDPGVAYIRSDGNDTTGDGSPSAPYLTVQKAITEGYKTLNLGLGTFAGAATTQTGHFSIIGAGEHLTIITGLNFIASDYNNRLTVRGCYIGALTLPGGGNFIVEGAEIGIIDNDPTGGGGALYTFHRCRIHGTVDCHGATGGDGADGGEGENGGDGGVGATGSTLTFSFCDGTATQIIASGGAGGVGGQAGTGYAPDEYSYWESVGGNGGEGGPPGSIYMSHCNFPNATLYQDPGGGGEGGPSYNNLDAAYDGMPGDAGGVADTLELRYTSLAALAMPTPTNVIIEFCSINSSTFEIPSTHNIIAGSVAP